MTRKTALSLFACAGCFCQVAFGQQISDRAAARLLDQASWGPNPTSIAQVQQAGITGWLTQQFALNTSDLPDQALLNSAGNTNTDVGPVRAAFFQNALTGNDQLRQRVAFALSQIWVVSQVSGVSNAYAFPPYWRVFRDNAFAKYSDLIRAVSLNPAMGRYLNMANNNKGNTAKGTQPNENYARELMQLFTIGLVQLNMDGSMVLDSKGNPVPTYTETDVTNVAKAFTGWTYPTAPSASPASNNPAYYIGNMFSVAANHDTTAKTIFGNYVIPAGQTADQDLTSVINALMQQTTMAPFVCKQLIQHLVTSNPSPGYISRVSSVFLNDGTGTRGNLQAVITAILTDVEARAGDDPSSAVNANFGHLREPILFLTSALRGLNATTNSSNVVGNVASALSENLFNAPSVFSYFSPQSRTERGLFGPEFQIYSTQTAASRANYVYNMIYSTTGIDSNTPVNLAPFNAKLPTNTPANQAILIDYISSVFLDHGMSADLKQAATSAAQAATSAANAVKAALYIVLTSGEYQVVH